MARTQTSTLLKRICQLPLLDPSQRKELDERLQPQFTELDGLCNELLRRGWMTRYQIQQCLANRQAELTVGPYGLLEKLGEGGNGQVFKARHQRLNRVVALKVVRPELLADPEVVQRFYR